VPSASLIPVAVIAEIVRVIDKFPNPLFYRGSEVQELGYYYYILLYLIMLAPRLRSPAWRTRAAAA